MWLRALSPSFRRHESSTEVYRLLQARRWQISMGGPPKFPKITPKITPNQTLLPTFIPHFTLGLSLRVE